MEHAETIATLPVLQRLALAYAPADKRLPTLAFLALDTRLAGVVRQAGEPLAGQLRLAWWRDRLGEDAGAWPRGEPLLELLRDWQGMHAMLAPLVDGWETMLGESPLPSDAFEQLAEGRAAGFAALAGVIGHADAALDAQRMGRNWALHDLATNLGDPREAGLAAQLAHGQDWRRAPLPRGLRPLAVLHGLAKRGIVRGGVASAATPGALLAAMRIGMFGI